MSSKHCKNKDCLFMLMIAACLLFTDMTQAAVNYQSVESIVETARAFTLKNLPSSNRKNTVITGKIDNRLKLKACTQELEAFFPEYGRRTGNITVGVRCNGKENWSLFVPISVKVYQEIIVVNKPLAKGTILARTDLTTEERDINTIPINYYSDYSSIVGMELQRPIQNGQALSSIYLKKPIAIRRGNLVTLMSKNPIIEVRMEGTALSDGAIGNRVKVKNSRSNRIIEGIVKSSTVVEVN